MLMPLSFSSLSHPSALSLASPNSLSPTALPKLHNCISLSLCPLSARALLLRPWDTRRTTAFSRNFSQLFTKNTSQFQFLFPMKSLSPLTPNTTTVTEVTKFELIFNFSHQLTSELQSSAPLPVLPITLLSLLLLLLARVTKFHWPINRNLVQFLSPPLSLSFSLLLLLFSPVFSECRKLMIESKKNRTKCKLNQLNLLHRRKEKVSGRRRQVKMTEREMEKKINWPMTYQMNQLTFN